ncbi:MBL fold metallo-hydrolase [Streptomyces sp. NPDC007264]|uniref:MBL fold metallo-hydrolase n=1 Tax=Streptomyces sp. NPDC007264 TaxID=3364777 RepID=UPI0036D8C8D9
MRRIVLTHFHEDHAGGAGEFAALSGAEVLVHRRDAPMTRGEVQGPPPVLEEGERPIHAGAASGQAARHLPRGDIVRPGSVTELSGGEVLGFGGGARVIPTPGRTHGSAAVHLPEHGVFHGDPVVGRAAAALRASADRYSAAP